MHSLCHRRNTRNLLFLIDVLTWGAWPVPQAGALYIGSCPNVVQALFIVADLPLPTEPAPGLAIRRYCARLASLYLPASFGGAHAE